MGSWIEERLFEIESIPLDTPPPKPRRYRSSADEARAFGQWTLSKLDVLRLYLTMYRRVAGNGTYLDGFAGSGQVDVKGEVQPGSARLALESGAFRALHLFELQRMIPRLEANLAGFRHADRVTFHPGDANQAIPALLQADAISRERPCFALLDPDSTQLAWTTVEALAGYKTADAETGACKIELWILFNLEQAIQRLWPTDKTIETPPHASVLDRIMGDRAAWSDLWNEGRSAVALLHRYCSRLQDLGYAFVYPQQIVDPASGRRQYWMIHATDHPAAERFMRWAKKASDVPLRVQLPGDWDLTLDRPGDRDRRQVGS